MNERISSPLGGGHWSGPHSQGDELDVSLETRANDGGELFVFAGAIIGGRRSGTTTPFSNALVIRFATVLLIAMCGYLTATKAAAAANSADDPVTLEGFAREHWPDTFAGLWGDLPLASNLCVAFTADASQHATELQQLAFSAGLSHPQLVPVTAAYPLNHLERLAGRIEKHRTQSQNGQRRMPGTHGGRFDLNIDVSSNRIEVLLPRPSAKTRRTFARYGPAVVVTRGSLTVPYSPWWVG